MSLSVETEALLREAGKWSELAEEMATIRSATADLWLGLTAFFIGDSTERAHYNAYRSFHDRIVHRLEGAAIEFELVGITLRRIAADLENGEQITAQDFRAAEEEVQRATETHTTPSDSGGGGYNWLE